METEEYKEYLKMINESLKIMLEEHGLSGKYYNQEDHKTDLLESWLLFSTNPKPTKELFKKISMKLCQVIYIKSLEKSCLAKEWKETINKEGL